MSTTDSDSFSNISNASEYIPIDSIGLPSESVTVEKQQAPLPSPSPFPKLPNGTNEVNSNLVSMIKLRIDTIHKLREIKNDLERNGFNSNIYKILGASCGLLGSAMAGVGVFLIPMTSGLSLTLTLSGATMAGGGGFMTTGAVIGETVVNHKLLSSARQLLLEDIKMSTHLTNNYATFTGGVTSVSGMSQLSKTVSPLVVGNVAGAGMQMSGTLISQGLNATFFAVGGVLNTVEIALAAKSLKDGSAALKELKNAIEILEAELRLLSLRYRNGISEMVVSSIKIAELMTSEHFKSDSNTKEESEHDRLENDKSISPPNIVDEPERLYSPLDTRLNYLGTSLSSVADSYDGDCSIPQKPSAFVDKSRAHGDNSVGSLICQKTKL